MLGLSSCPDVQNQSMRERMASFHLEPAFSSLSMEIVYHHVLGREKGGGPKRDRSRLLSSGSWKSCGLSTLKGRERKSWEGEEPNLRPALSPSHTRAAVAASYVCVCTRAQHTHTHCSHTLLPHSCTSLTHTHSHLHSHHTHAGTHSHTCTPGGPSPD